MVSLTTILVVSCAVAVFSLLPRPNTSSLKSLDSPPTSRTRDAPLAPACQIGADLRPPVPFQKSIARPCRPAAGDTGMRLT